MSRPESLRRLADAIDPERAGQLRADLRGRDDRDLAVLLGSAFPALTASADWQHDALAQIQRSGWRVRRRRADLLKRLRDAASRPGDRHHVWRCFRRVIWREKVRIALRELLPHYLGGMGVDITARELSNLADAVFEVALEEATRHVTQRFGQARRADGEPSRLVMLGLGKLGGRELNPGSDVDVMFVYDADDDGGEISLHEYWTRVVQRAVQVVSTPSDHGLIWRVDLRLRPEGSQGPLVNSVLAAERYYETWGRLWERAALLRARTSAGDPSLGAEFSRAVIAPFVYRHEVDPRIAETLTEMVERSREELCEAPARDLKLGPGGIREAEFFVQSLQLIWGGREPVVRVQSAFRALARLSFRGLVTDREARELAAAYTLLRRCEHRLQWIYGIQTHVLPNHVDQLAHLARTLGMEDEVQLERALLRARAVVQRLFGSLRAEAPAPAPRYRALLRQIERGRTEFDDPVEEIFADPDLAEHLVALARRPDDLLGAHTREHLPDLAEAVLDAIAQSPDPLQAAHYLRTFFARLQSPAAYIALMARDQQFLSRFITVLGASVFVGDAVVARPEMSDVFLEGTAHVGDPRAAVRAELQIMRQSLEPDADRYDRQDRFLSAIRRAKHAVTLAVAVADLSGVVQTRQATALLSELAEETLLHAVDFVLEGNTDGLAVIAVGKLGGGEVGYGSDLDVLFIYDPGAAPPGKEASEYFIRRAQRIIRLISEPHVAGRGYELDTRLRPSGSQGLLVTSLRSFARYHHVPLPGEARDSGAPGVLSSGEAWERQVLLRARPCAGDLRLGARVVEVAEVAAYERGAPPVEEMHHLRERMERELGREQPPRRYDLKTGRGGLLDIEFATQWLQMRHGEDHGVRTPDTGEALEALHTGGYLAARDFETMRDGYAFLRRLEQRIHVLHGAGSATIQADHPGLWRLARRMRIRDTARGRAEQILMSRYRQVTEEVRAAYLRVLGLDG